MSYEDYKDPLYRECIGRRLTAADPARMADGPTARFAELEREREKWALVLEVGDDEVPAA